MYEITEQNFGPEVLGRPGRVLVDFAADWCAPCRALAPLLERAAGERPEVFFGRVDVDRNPALAARFAVMSIPHLVLFEDGRVLNAQTGVPSPPALAKLLDGDYPASSASSAPAA